MTKTDFFPKVRGQYRLTTGENRLFRTNLKFALGGQKGPKNGPKMDPPGPKNGQKIFYLFITQNHSIRKKKLKKIGPFRTILTHF